MLFLKAGVQKIIKPIVPLLVTFLKISTSIPTINQLASKFLNLGRNHMKDVNNFIQFTMSQALLAKRSRETVLFTPFGDEK